jgi:hypothetical protein
VTDVTEGDPGSGSPSTSLNLARATPLDFRGSFAHNVRMRHIVLLASLGLLAIMPAPNLRPFEVANTQMVVAYNRARATMLDALAPANRRLLGTLASQLVTSTTPDYLAAAQRLDRALSATERNSILQAAHTEHEAMHQIMHNVRPTSMSDAAIFHIGSGPMDESDSAGTILLHVVMSAGPMTMNTMIVFDR